MILAYVEQAIFDLDPLFKNGSRAPDKWRHSIECKLTPATRSLKCVFSTLIMTTMDFILALDVEVVFSLECVSCDAVPLLHSGTTLRAAVYSKDALSEYLSPYVVAERLCYIYTTYITATCLHLDLHVLMRSLELAGSRS